MEDHGFRAKERERDKKRQREPVECWLEWMRDKRKESENSNEYEWFSEFIFLSHYYSELCGVHDACVPYTHTCQSILPSSPLFISQHSAQHFCFVFLFWRKKYGVENCTLRISPISFHFISTLNHLAANASENSEITGQRPWRELDG